MSLFSCNCRTFGSSVGKNKEKVQQYDLCAKFTITLLLSAIVMTLIYLVAILPKE